MYCSWNTWVKTVVDDFKSYSLTVIEAVNVVQIRSSCSGGCRLRVELHTPVVQVRNGDDDDCTVKTRL